MGGENSQNDFQGYHNAFSDAALGQIYYAVVPHPIGNSDIRGFNSLQQQTEVSSHELAEGTTDPDVQTGWRDYFNTGGEIGDLAEGNFGLLDGYVVQAEYSNNADGPILPAGATRYDAGGAAAGPMVGPWQANAGGCLFTPLGNPLQTSGMHDSSRVANLSARTHAETPHDAFFADLAVRESDGTELLSLGSSVERYDWAVK
jgi:hypothetical protein